MVIVTLQQIINERISFLRYQINPNNKPEVNSTFQLQIDVIRSVDDIANVEPPYFAKEGSTEHSKDIPETDRLLAELDALE
jgi:hypothetical protein